MLACRTGSYSGNQRLPIEQFSAKEALQNKRSNKSSDWPKPAKDGNRLLPIALPDVHPRFTISRNEKIFCIGSCFAREVENHFDRMGFDVLSLGVEIPNELQSDVPDGSYGNKYTVGSILNEVERALAPEKRDAKDCLIEIDAGKFADHQLTGTRHVAPFEEMLAIRSAFEANFQRLKDADVVVLTLGLSEAFKDTKTGLTLNRAPSPKTLRREPDRFVLEVLDFAQTQEALAKLYALLERNLRPGFRVLLTVSPVALLATFRDQDVIVANSYSKAVLRAAAEEFMRDRANVSYFPSFEMAGLSQSEAVWENDDFRHVHRDFVEIIMSHALSAYVPEAKLEMESRRLLATVRTLIRIGRPKDAADIQPRKLPAGHIKKEILRELARAKTLSATQNADTAAMPKASPLFRLEKAIVKRLLSARKQKKFWRNRAAFFEDSGSGILRLYGRITR